MMQRERLRLAVLDELAYDSAVDSSAICVTVGDCGMVSLSGWVPTFLQVRAAEQAARRVRGVQALANWLEVEPPRGAVRDDASIADAAARAIEGSASIPKGVVRVSVSSGWVTLEGQVSSDFQRRTAGDAVADLLGVRGVTNLMTIRHTDPGEIEDRIEEAFRRNAEIDANQVAVSVSGGRVVLRGAVSSWAEKEAAERAAYAATGVVAVENRIEVMAHLFA